VFRKGIARRSVTTVASAIQTDVANAVIGLSFTCGAFHRQGTKKERCSISAYGTAVKIKTK
jgi:uncharacterized protein YbjQ (UPF0145 family)